MALSRALFLFSLIVTIFSTMTMAKDFVVGDKNGWTLGVDYQTWAANKVFRVGDTLSKLISFIFSLDQSLILSLNIRKIKLISFFLNIR
jgi:hypothetical protein